MSLLLVRILQRFKRFVKDFIGIEDLLEFVRNYKCNLIKVNHKIGN
jgi:hypothetical protein